MINCILTRGRGHTLRHLKNTALKGRFRVMSYERMFQKRSWPAGPYVFMDLERLAPWELRLAAAAFHELKEKQPGVAMLNDPARAMGRYRLLRTLHEEGLNDFNCYRADEKPRPGQFPVFLRGEDDHAGPLSDLINTQTELDDELETRVRTGRPLRGLLVVEYAAEPYRPGMYLKYGAFRVGERIVPHHFVGEDRWVVKYGKLGLATEEDFRAEQDYLESNPHAGHLMQVFRLANIDYGRVDYGLVGGKIQIYEINTNPDIHFLKHHRSALKLDNIWRGARDLVEALAALDPSPLRRGRIRLDAELLGRHRDPWRKMRLLATGKRPSARP